MLATVHPLNHRPATCEAVATKEERSSPDSLTTGFHENLLTLLPLSVSCGDRPWFQFQACWLDVQPSRRLRLH